MLRCILVLLLLPLSAFSATVRLYLKDGSFQMVREYQVQQDRVRFFSTEREEWEEIPLDMIDLARTRKDIDDHATAVVEEAKAEAEEDKALADAAKEITMVPGDPGVYYVRGEKLETIKIADAKIVDNKARKTLKLLSPVPLAGKQTVELDGDNAPVRVADTRPEFYFRLTNEERFGIFKLTKTQKSSRIVDRIDVEPVSKEVSETFEEVPSFKKQSGDMLFKIWPEKDLEPGEYALVEHTDGKLSLQVWDFGVGEGTPAPAEKKKSILERLGKKKPQ
jgi:hypothetical protein